MIPNFKTKFIFLLFFTFFISIYAHADINLTLNLNVQTNAIDFVNLPNNTLTNQPLSFVKYRIQKKSYDRSGKALDPSWITWKTGNADENGQISYIRRNIPSQSRKIRVQIRFESPHLRIIQFGDISHDWLTIAESNEPMAVLDGAYAIDYGNRIFNRSAVATEDPTSELATFIRENLYNNEQHLRSLLFYYSQKYARYYDSLSDRKLKKIDLIYPMPDVLKNDRSRLPFAPPVDIEGLIIRFLTQGPLHALALSYAPDSDIYLVQEYMHLNTINLYSRLDDQIYREEDEDRSFYEGFRYDRAIFGYPAEIQNLNWTDFNLFVIHRNLASLMAHEVNHIWYGQMVPGRLPIALPHEPGVPEQMNFFEAVGILSGEYWYAPFNDGRYFELHKNTRKERMPSFFEDPDSITLENYNQLSISSAMILNNLVRGESLFYDNYSNDGRLFVDAPYRAPTTDAEVSPEAETDDSSDPIFDHSMTDETREPSRSFGIDYSYLIYTLPLTRESLPQVRGFVCPKNLSFSVEEILRTVDRWGESGLWKIEDTYDVFRFLEMLEEQRIIDNKTHEIALHYADPRIENNYELFCQRPTLLQADLPGFTNTKETSLPEKQPPVSDGDDHRAP